MSKVFEKISQELTLELYNLKIKLKFAEEKIQEQNERILKITDNCVMLEAENVFLKRQLNEYSTPKAIRQFQTICPAPFKSEPDQASCSSDNSNWSVVGRPRKSRLSGAGDSFDSETSSNSLRIHVNRISPSTTEKALRDYFSRFGVVEDVFVRGPDFAFVTFGCYFGESPLATAEHVIDGNRVELKIAKKNFSPTGKPSSKLLVTPTSEKLTNEVLHGYFSKYGNVVDISRGSNVAFILFDSPQCIDKAFLDDHVIEGVVVYICRVREREANERNNIKTRTILVSADVEVMKKITVSDLKTYFESFGKIVGVRKPTVRSEATHFAFVQFSSTDAVEKVLADKYHSIKGFQVNISKSHST